MIRVIKSTHPFIEETCSHCGSIFEYQESDIIHSHIGRFLYTKIYCPVCGKSIIFSKGELVC